MVIKLLIYLYYNPMLNLTQAQRRILGHFKKYCVVNGYGPTVRKLSEIDGTYYSNVHRILNDLVTKGAIGKHSKKGSTWVWNTFYLKGKV